MKKHRRRKVVKFPFVVLGAAMVLSFTAGRITAPDEVEAKTVFLRTPLPAVAAEESESTYYDVPLSHELQDYIFSLCEEKKVPAALIFAMIDKESSFKADTVSATNDYGLMQINKINHARLSEAYGVTDFLNPYENVKCGIEIISGLFNKYDSDIHAALMAYNMGEAGARKLWDKGVVSSEYSRAVASLMETKYEGVDYD